MSEVFWMDHDCMSADNSITHKLQRLFDASGASDKLDRGMRVAIKINTAEDGYEYGLSPVFIRTIALEIQKTSGLSSVICDGLKIIDYNGKLKGRAFQDTAGEKGYSDQTLCGSLVINGGFSGDEGNSYVIKVDNSMLGGVEVGTAICRTDALMVLSHVTLHPLFGVCGALLNGGFESLISKERMRILEGLNPYVFTTDRPANERLERFQRRALEGHVAVREAMGARVFYINYLWNVTPEPEYYPYSNIPIMPNLGFMASDDPVALDAATYGVLREFNEGKDPVENHTGVNFPRVLAVACELGLGTLDYTVGRAS